MAALASWSRYRQGFSHQGGPPIGLWEEVLARLHQAYRNLPVGLLTALGAVEGAVPAMCNGASDCLPIPFKRANPLDGSGGNGAHPDRRRRGTDGSEPKQAALKINNQT